MKAKALEAVDGYLPLVRDLIHVLVLIALGYLATIIVNRLIRAIRGYSVRVMIEHGGLLQAEVEKRATTVATLIRRTLLSLLWVAIAINSLHELGFKVDALLAGAGLSAGIVGVAVGFGAQTLIKDVIAGIFILIENQIRVGDVAIINTIGGTVEEINLRTTVLRSENGAVHVIPNGSVQTLANLTRDFSYYVFELTLRHDQDPGPAIDVLRAVATEMRNDPQYAASILDDLDVSGLDRFTPAGNVLKARVKTLPAKQWPVGREMNRRILARFAENGIALSPGPTEFKQVSAANQL